MVELDLFSLIVWYGMAWYDFVFMVWYGLVMLKQFVLGSADIYIHKKACRPAVSV